MANKKWADRDGWQGLSRDSERLLISLIRTGDPGETRVRLGLTITGQSKALRRICELLNVASSLHALLLYQRYRESQGIPIPLDIKPLHQDTPDENP